MKLPSDLDLKLLRKGLRKKLPPQIKDGDHGYLPKLGEFKVLSKNSELYLEWRLLDQSNREVKIAKWLDLCKEINFEHERLEIGYMLHEMYSNKAKEIRDSIGHPMLAIQYADPYEELANRWKHWGIVQAGFMLRL
jgi:hypothetical protein